MIFVILADMKEYNVIAQSVYIMNEVIYYSLDRRKDTCRQDSTAYRQSD